MVTKAHLDEIKRLNALTSYPDAQAVYEVSRFYSGDSHECYWMFWTSCGFRGGSPAQGIRCYICGKPWEGIDGQEA